MKSLLFLRGRFFCLCSFEPFTTRPVFGVCLRPSSSSVWFVSSATFFSLSLSLRRWGTPNLFGLGFPLCFFILDTLSALDPYALLVTYTQASPRTCFFFFFLLVVVARFWFGVFLFLVLSVLVVLVGGFFVPGPGLCRGAALSLFPFLALWRFLSSGLVGFPLPRFLVPLPLWRFFPLGGWGSPCRVFPVFSPWFFPARLHLASSLARWFRIGKPGHPTRNPPGPHRSCTWLVPPRPSPAGSRRGYESSTRAVG